MGRWDSNGFYFCSGIYSKGINNGRFISDRGSGTSCYYDSRHKPIRTLLSGGGFAELIKKLQPDGSHRNQFLAICGPDGEREVIEYDLNDKQYWVRELTVIGTSNRRLQNSAPYFSVFHTRNLRPSPARRASTNAERGHRNYPNAPFR
jgi:hypothetical protein